ncbi:hypothetical protein RCL1_003071 [Eukaryota sp. TZLM3-RCL]
MQAKYLTFTFTFMSDQQRKLDYDRARNHSNYSKRLAALMKKSHELSILTGTQVLLIVVSETGTVSCFASDKFQPLAMSTQLHSMLTSCLSGHVVPSSPIVPIDPPQLEEIDDSDSDSDPDQDDSELPRSFSDPGGINITHIDLLPRSTSFPNPNSSGSFDESKEDAEQ